MPTTFELFAAFAALFTAIYVYVTKYAFTHFQRLGIPDLSPTFPFGNGFKILTATKQLSLLYKDFYERLKTSGARYGGFFVFTTPNLLVIDTEVIKSVLIKDFNKFTDRGLYENERDDPIAANMFSKDGEKWKEIRTKLSPTFTSGKMKGMFEVVVKCSEPMLKYVDNFVENKEAVNVKEMFSLFTVDSIGSCAFGLDCNSFTEGGSDFYKEGQRAINPSLIVLLKSVFAINFPDLAKKLRMKVTEERTEKFYMSVFNNTLSYRKETNSSRKDFMQLLMGLLDNGIVTHTQAVAEALLFLVAGYETSATTGSFVLFELAQNRDVQDKLREEIREMLEKHDGQLTYEGVQEMKYLGQVVDETLRKYPPLGFLNRMAIANYQIPGTKIVLKKGARIVIPTYALQHDPDYFPNPEKFDPERFNDDNKKNIKPFTYMPFGDGPRNCIGMRFALMQTKIGLVRLLRNHEFKLNRKMQLPIEFDVKQLLLQVKGGVWLNVEKV